VNLQILWLEFHQRFSSNIDTISTFLNDSGRFLLHVYKCVSLFAASRLSVVAALLAWVTSMSKLRKRALGVWLTNLHSKRGISHVHTAL
jgi:hypothetical protein